MRAILILALVFAVWYVIADVPSCNPFSKYEETKHVSTCEKSAIVYGAYGGNLTVVASLSDCGKANTTSQISAVFADKRIKLQTAESFIFTYTISTTSSEESCVVFLQTADRPTPTDQNGFSNSPDIVRMKYSYLYLYTIII
mgnify:CR=1 FL=1